MLISISELSTTTMDLISKNAVLPKITVMPRLTFPFRLHMVLSDAVELGVSDVVSWDTSGSKFIIYDQGDFVSRVLSHAFKMSKFSSFKRQLNAYGFEREATSASCDIRIASENSSGIMVYSHIHFHRDNRGACAKITRKRPQLGIPRTVNTTGSGIENPYIKTSTMNLLDQNQRQKLETLESVQPNHSFLSLSSTQRVPERISQNKNPQYASDELSIVFFDALNSTSHDDEEINDKNNNLSDYPKIKNLSTEIHRKMPAQDQRKQDDDSILYPQMKDSPRKILTLPSFSASLPSSAMSESNDEQFIDGEKILLEHRSSNIARRFSNGNNLSDAVLDELAAVTKGGFGVDDGGDMVSWDPQQESLKSDQTSPGSL